MASVKLSEEDKEWLRQNYLFVSDAEIMQLFGYRNEAAVRKIRQLLGLKRSKDTYKQKIKQTPIVVWIPSECSEVVKEVLGG